MRRVDEDAFREVGEFFVRPTFKGLDAMFVPFAHSLPGAEDRMTIEDVVTRHLA